MVWKRVAPFKIWPFLKPIQTSVYILALPFLTSTKGAGGRIGRNSSGNGPLPLDMASKRRLWSEVTTIHGMI